MAPKVKFTKVEMIAASLAVARRKGVAGVTARNVAAELGGSTRPIFTYYDTLAELRKDTLQAAENCFFDWLRLGLKADIPFLGFGLQYIAFAREEPMLYQSLFMTPSAIDAADLVDTFRRSADIVRGSIMDTYHMDAAAADHYYRNMWLVVYSLAALVVLGNCPYTDEDMRSILSEFSAATCKAIKEIPGFAGGRFDRDTLFAELTEE